MDGNLLRDLAPRHGWSAVGSANAGTLRMTCLGTMLERGSTQQEVWDSGLWGSLEKVCHTAVKQLVLPGKGGTAIEQIVEGLCATAYRFVLEKVGGPQLYCAPVVDDVGHAYRHATCSGTGCAGVRRWF